MASAAIKPVPMFQEGIQYWQELLDYCKRHAQAINTTVARATTNAKELLELNTNQDFNDIYITKPGYPSTQVKATLSFESWGPLIRGAITGLEDGETKFKTEEFEYPLAKDLDGRIVTVFAEGRSFSPQEFAGYLTQNFCRCYPEISLPCWV